jgi:antitoxin PrlF
LSLILTAAHPTGSINNFIGLLANRNKKTATLEEIKQAGVKAWSGEK